MAHTIDIVPRELTGLVRLHAKISPLYEGAVKEIIGSIIARAFGASAPDLTWFPSHVVTAQNEAEHVYGQVYRQTLEDVSRQGPQLMNGDTLRAFQIVFDGRAPEIRINLGIDGILGVDVLPSKKGDQLELRPWFRLLPADLERSHVTVFLGQVKGASAAMVLTDFVPSMIRGVRASPLADRVHMAIPPASRARWRGIRARLLITA